MQTKILDRKRMNWKSWKQRMNVIPVDPTDILHENQKLIIDTKRGITYEATFIKREGKRLVINTLFPIKETRTINTTEPAYRLANSYDDQKIKKGISAVQSILNMTSQHQQTQ